jgi:hypothetical protein
MALASIAPKYIEVDVDQKARIAGISHESMEFMIIIGANRQRSVSEQERQTQLTALAKQLEDEGVPPEKIARRVCELVGFTEQYVYRLLPTEYKNALISNNTRQGMKSDPNLSLGSSEVTEVSLLRRKGDYTREPDSVPLKGLTNDISLVARSDERPLMLRFLQSAGFTDAKSAVVFSKGYGNSRGSLQTFTADLCIESAKIVMMSKDVVMDPTERRKRDEFFEAAGYRVIHASERHMSDYGSELARIIGELA